MSNQPSRTIVQENNVLRLRPGSEPTPSSSNQQPPQQEQQQETTSTKKKKKKKAPKVRWTEGTVDNEHMNKKKTKICCIFHPQRSFDEEVEDDKHNHSCSSSDEVVIPQITKAIKMKTSLDLAMAYPNQMLMSISHIMRTDQNFLNKDKHRCYR